ncbi:MAG TPA: hypothetical protein PLL98_11330 [Bacillota bacterium]|nr:hypothetical protein [Bacillota bacterium]HOR87061.1 hypothetical protein [Bacillota bacterium]
MKKILTVMLTVLLAVSLAGCSFDSLGDYRKAAEKTDQIKKGQMEGAFSVVMDFNTAGMTEEQVKELNYFKEMKGNFSAAYDDEEGKGIFRNYLNFGGLGFDFDLFVNGEEMFVKLPILGKYMEFDKMQQAEGASGIISKETENELSAKWLGLLNKEDVFKGKDIVLTTPDGEVKTKEYTIKLNNDQIKVLAEECMDIVSRDEKLKENYEKYIKKSTKQLEDISLEKLISSIKEEIKNYRVENFSYTAHVDIDGYIVNEVIEVYVKAENREPAGMNDLNYRLELKNWDINKKQEFEFPVLTEENTMNIDKMNQNMPFMIDNLFDNKD